MVKIVLKLDGVFLTFFLREGEEAVGKSNLTKSYTGGERV